AERAGSDQKTQQQRQGPEQPGSRGDQIERRGLGHGQSRTVDKREGIVAFTGVKSGEATVQCGLSELGEFRSLAAFTCGSPPWNSPSPLLVLSIPVSRKNSVSPVSRGWRRWHVRNWNCCLPMTTRRRWKDWRAAVTCGCSSCSMPIAAKAGNPASDHRASGVTNSWGYLPLAHQCARHP